jgi:hypothetical protein
MFNALSQDMALQRSFREDMTSVMRAFGLGPAEQKALKSGDAGKIKKMLTGAEPLCFIIGLSIGSKGE